MPAREPSPVGNLLRYWRNARKLSQLDLALEAEISARHISFLETGRSKPSREMLLLLADVLDVPLRERNVLLEAAGFSGIYRETDLGAEEMKPVRRALQFILDHHEPYGCIVVDRRWDVLMMNGAVMRQMAHFLSPERLVGGAPLNAFRVCFEDHGLRPWIENWDEVAYGLIQRLHREAMAADPNSEARALLSELLATDGVPEGWRAPDLSLSQSPMLPLCLAKDGLRLELFSTVATLGTPLDITLQELRIESFFPANEATDHALRQLAQ
jgi:transcriptional regulator with XRE-family HTH domain